MRNKTSNIYTEWLPLIESLPNEQAGILLKNILKYQNGEEIICDNPIWIFIKSKLDDYNNKGEEISEARKIAGQLGGLAKASNCYQKLANDSKVSNKRKEKKRKEKKIIIKENKENTDFDFIENPEWKELFIQYIDYRKKIKKALNPVSYQSAYDKLLKLSKSNLISAREIVGNSIASGWQGLFKIDDKVSKSTNKQTRLEKNIDIIKNCEL